MTMDGKNDLSFKELANIALGSPNLSAQHLNVLCGLIMCLLRKLGCNNETVTITGSAAVCLKKLLKQLDIPLYTFNYNNENNSLVKHSKLLTQLEIRTVKQIDKLNDHFQQIRECHMKFLKTSVWNHYTMVNEEISNEPKIEWYIKNNAYFIYRLQQYISKPCVQKIIALEEQIDELRNKLAHTKMIFEESSRIMLTVKCLYEDIQHLKQTVYHNYEEFLYTLQEIDKMVKCKVDRIVLPALRKSLRKIFNVMHSDVHELLVNSHDCEAVMHPMIIIKSKNFCLSCTQSSQKSATKKKKYRKQIEEFAKCYCEKFHEINLQERFERMQYKTIRINEAVLPLLSHHVARKILSEMSLLNFIHAVADLNIQDEFNEGAEVRRFSPLLTFRTDMKRTFARRSFAPSSIAHFSLTSIF